MIRFARNCLPTAKSRFHAPGPTIEFRSAARAGKAQFEFEALPNIEIARTTVMAWIEGVGVAQIKAVTSGGGF
jgi:hypothetical protein